ncbi:MAG: helix-turn-helix transcriptional regulator [Alphaproteobacteria bacterium]
MEPYLTTRELAALLRIKERKVYDLAASGGIPCTRALGKLLFPRAAVNAWLADASSGFTASTPPRPNVFLGSHDPLLDWALRESRAGIATFFDGSLDGLDRFERAEGAATGLHLHEPADDAWNITTVRDRFGASSVVLVEWAWRMRGLIVAPDAAKRLKSIADLRGKRVTPRQPEAGSQGLLRHLLGDAKLDESDIAFTEPARTETDAALAVLEGKADAALGLAALAAQYRLGFVPLIRERFDLLVDRRAWFEPPMQVFLEFCRTDSFTKRAAEFDGYDTSGLGTVRFNGG